MFALVRVAELREGLSNPDRRVRRLFEMTESLGLHVVGR